MENNSVHPSSKPQLKKLIWELYQSGLSMGAIAVRVGLSRAGVNWHLRGRPLRNKSEAMKLAVESQRYAVRSRGASPSWKGGRSHLVSGYATTLMPNGRYVLEHRVIMEGLLGRPLLPTEQVHHINHVRDDNRPENLELVDRAAHTRQHWQELTVGERLSKIQPAWAAWRNKGVQRAN